MTRKRKADGTAWEPESFDGGSQNNPASRRATDVAPGRRKRSTASRIGRACDRCQHRKLACDPAPQGCQPCQRVNAWCVVTDPLTLTPTYRGEFEYLERKVAEQNGEIKELLNKLRDLGQDVLPYLERDEETEKYEAWTTAKASNDVKPWDRDDKQHGAVPSRPMVFQPKQNDENVGARNGADDVSEPDQLPIEASNRSVGDAPSLPDVRIGLAPRNYVGISNNLSTKTDPGIRLNMLGWEIDIASFTGDTEDESEELPTFTQPLYDRSYRSFIATAYGLQPKIPRPQIPSRQEAFTYATQYLYITGAFVPILHKPTLMKLLTKVYEEPDHSPSVAEIVCLHLLFASSLYQLTLRNYHDVKNSSDILEISDRHYHYALGFFPQLMAGGTLEDMQAAAMLCVHVRNFPKPEIVWTAISATFNRLVQLGYHRSASSGQPWVAQKKFVEIELRKRVFWSVLAIHITASGKLGRPMPIRCEDFDVELPLAVDDDQLLEAGLDESKKGLCYFMVGLEAIKIVPIYIDLYNFLYAAKKSPDEYVEFVGEAEKRIADWKKQWHPMFKQADSSSNNPLTRVWILYLNMWSLEYRLLLFHPSLSMTKSIRFNEANLRKCLEATREILHYAMAIQELKSLDTTWGSCAVYMLAIQTTIYGRGQLKADLDREKVNQLKQDMSSWLSIMGDIGRLLGSDRLQNAVRKQVEIGLTQLESQLENKLKGSGDMPKPKDEPLYSQKENTVGEDIPAHSSSEGAEHFERAAVFNGLDHLDGQYQHAETGIQPVNVQAAQNLPTFQPTDSYSYPLASRPYTSTDLINLNNSSTASGQVPSYDLAESANHAAGNDGIYPQTPGHVPDMTGFGADSNSWYLYTQTIPQLGMGSLDYSPANALLQLSNGPDHNDGLDHRFDMRLGNSGTMQTWPHVILDPQSL